MSFPANNNATKKNSYKNSLMNFPSNDKLIKDIKSLSILDSNGINKDVNGLVSYKKTLVVNGETDDIAPSFTEKMSTEEDSITGSTSSSSVTGPSHSGPTMNGDGPLMMAGSSKRCRNQLRMKLQFLQDSQLTKDVSLSNCDAEMTEQEPNSFKDVTCNKAQEVNVDQKEQNKVLTNCEDVEKSQISMTLKNQYEIGSAYEVMISTPSTSTISVIPCSAFPGVSNKINTLYQTPTPLTLPQPQAMPHQLGLLATAPPAYYPPLYMATPQAPAAIYIQSPPAVGGSGQFQTTPSHQYISPSPPYPAYFLCSPLMAAAANSRILQPQQQHYSRLPHPFSSADFHHQQPHQQFLSTHSVSVSVPNQTFSGPPNQQPFDYQR